MTARTLVAITAGLGQPSASRLLADRLATATATALRDDGAEVATETIELRAHARPLVDHLLTGFAAPELQATIDRVLAADGLVVVSPVFNASYSGLFKLFFDVLERDSLARVPVLLGAVGGTARHSLVIDHALRPLFAYLGADAVPTGVFAAPEDWGAGGSRDDAQPGLARRIERAGGELARAMASRPRRPAPDPFRPSADFADLLRAVAEGGDEAAPGR